MVWTGKLITGINVTKMYGVNLIKTTFVLIIIILSFWFINIKDHFFLS
jgi:hypothetical protein